MRATRTLLLTALVVATPVAAFTHPLGLLGAGVQDAVAAQEPEPDVPTIAEAQAHVQAQDFEAAEAAFAKIAAAQPQNGQAVFMHAYCLHMNGKLDEAHDRHLEAAAFPQFAAVANYNHACVHALRGDKDIAFTALAEARAAGFNNLNQLEIDTDMDNLRGDARFAQFLLDIQGASFDGTPLTAIAKLPAERRMDFSIGDWNVTNGDEAFGTSTITRAFEGKGIAASARNAEDGATRSMSTFVYDGEGETWRQVWVDRNGRHAVLEGGLEDDEMVLTMVSVGGEASTTGRAVYKSISADGFDLVWQTTPDEGVTWTDEVTLSYARQ